MLKEILLITAIVSAYDGDTIKVNGISYRLVGIDTPEIRSGCPTAEQRKHEHDKAIKARNHLRILIRHKDAKLQEVLCHGSNFGRKCGVLSIGGVTVTASTFPENLAHEYYCGSRGCPKRNWCDG